MDTKQTARCNESIMPEGEYNSHLCGRPIFEDGKCKIHCPSAVAQRRAKSDAAWKAKIAASPAMRLRACIADRDRLAAENEALRAALRGMMPEQTGIGSSMDWVAYNAAVTQARTALAKAKGGA